MALSHREGFIEIDWKSPRKDERLHLRIPREYVVRMYYDKTGESAKIYGTDNNGIEAIEIQAWLPDLTATPTGALTSSTLDESERHLFQFQNQLTVILSASAGHDKQGLIKNLYATIQKN